MFEDIPDVKLQDLMDCLDLDDYQWFTAYKAEYGYSLQRAFMGAVKRARVAEEVRKKKKKPGRPKSTGSKTMAMALCPASLLKIQAISEALDCSDGKAVVFALSKVGNPTEEEIKEHCSKNKLPRTQTRVGFSVEDLAGVMEVYNRVSPELKLRLLVEYALAGVEVARDCPQG